MTREEHIKNLEETVARYEKMKEQYSESLDVLEKRIDQLVKVEHFLPSSPRVKSLIDSQISTAMGLRGIYEYLNVTQERLEAAKNDPNYDHETWRSHKAKKNR